jgi:hypothetical protein
VCIRRPDLRCPQHQLLLASPCAVHSNGVCYGLPSSSSRPISSLRPPQRTRSARAPPSIIPCPVSELQLEPGWCGSTVLSHDLFLCSLGLGLTFVAATAG